MSLIPTTTTSPPAKNLGKENFTEKPTTTTTTTSPPENSTVEEKVTDKPATTTTTTTPVCDFSSEKVIEKTSTIVTVEDLLGKGKEKVSKKKTYIDDDSPSEEVIKSMRGKKWLPQEDERLLDAVYKGVPVYEIAESHGRSNHAILLRTTMHACKSVDDGMSIEDASSCYRLPTATIKSYINTPKYQKKGKSTNNKSVNPIENDTPECQDKVITANDNLVTTNETLVVLNEIRDLLKVLVTHIKSKRRSDELIQ